MAAFREGKVAVVTESSPHLVRALVETAIGEIATIGFPSMLGPLTAGDTVIVNTTGIELGLGTGGVGFILWNLSSDTLPPVEEGPIVKLRYTPWQMNVLAAEAPEGPHHAVMAEATSIDGMPVCVCGLHSQVAAAVAGIKAAAPSARVGYLMTDAAALPLEWSVLAGELREREMIDVTCTIGHAFGGDVEAVNVFSGLVALRLGEKVDVTVAAMGPGVVGTQTALGFSAIEQGQVLDAVTALGGRAVGALRLSFHDPRGRHRGVSAHTLAALTIAARERATIVVPELEERSAAFVGEQLDAAGVRERHELVTASGDEGLALLRRLDLEPASMGLRMRDAPELFLAGAAAGAVAADPARATSF